MEIEGIRKRKISKEKMRVPVVVQLFPALRKGWELRRICWVYGTFLLFFFYPLGGVEVIVDRTKKKKKKKWRIGEESDVPGSLQAGGNSGRDFLDKGKNARRKKSNMPDKSDQALESNEMEINNTTSSIGKSKGSKGQLEKAKRKKRKGLKLSGESDSLEGKIVEHDEDEVPNISSGDEDCSKGMKQWVSEYYQRRPGLKELQQRIDEFIVAHEAKLKQEKKEREARAAEGGWTVVTHHKGRKKTTEAESGVVVGSVSQAAMEEKMAKKKRKEVGLDFYRFQRKEAQRNELMMLQSKFEQDKKRIQELRAARKFRPF